MYLSVTEKKIKVGIEGRRKCALVFVCSFGFLKFISINNVAYTGKW